MSQLRARLTYSNVVATIALFVALGGSSYAAVTLTGRNIKDSTLTGKDVKDKSLTGADVKDSSLTGRDVRNGSIAAADLDPSLPNSLRGAQGAQGPQGLQGPKGDQGQSVPVDGFTKTESDARYLGKGTVQVFRVGADWRSGDGGTTSANSITAGKSNLSRGTDGTIQGRLPLSVPVALDGKRVRPTAARVCFLQPANATIVSVGVGFASGDSAADDAESQAVSVTDDSGCLNIDIKAILGTRNLAPDLGIDLVVLSNVSGGSKFLQLGAADVTLTPDP
jgi:hypothetical protein